MLGWFKELSRPSSFGASLRAAWGDARIRALSDGYEYVVTAIDIDIRAKVDPRPLALKVASFMGTAVASRRIENIGGSHADVAVIGRPDDRPLVAVAVGDSWTTLAFERVPDDVSTTMQASFVRSEGDD